MKLVDTKINFFVVEIDINQVFLFLLSRFSHFTKKQGK